MFFCAGPACCAAAGLRARDSSLLPLSCLQVTWAKDPLQGDDCSELRLQLLEVAEEAYPFRDDA